VTGTANLDLLHDASFALNDGSGGRAVTEPAVKRWLRLLNGAAIPTPEGVLLPPNDAGLSLAHAAWSGLREPLVLKAFGPGIVHKSELGAVRIGLRADQVADAISEMGHQLAMHRHARRGFYIEEQYQAGVELIVGAIRHPSVGPVVMLGMGGTFAEILDSSVVRLCPISRDDAEQMLEALPGAALLRGVRGKPPVDREALIELLLAIAGAGTPQCPSVVEALGD
jgi:hypothetical protein